MGLLTSSAATNNHNLYFSKDELAKILNLYSKGVSNGEWKDYAIDFNKNNPCRALGLTASLFPHFFCNFA